MTRPRIVIVGAGFAGFHAARGLRRMAKTFDVVLINPTDYFLYLPLLPEVAAGVLEPRRICVSLPHRLPHVELVLGTAHSVELDAHRVHWLDPEGRAGSTTYDRLVMTAGSANKLLPIPGVGTHAHGFRGIAEALYLRDHVTRQVELAANTSDQAERDARCTFVVVGAGYTGTEVAAQGQLLTTRLARKFRNLHSQRFRWILLDTAPRLLPQLDPRLSRTAERVLGRRGIEICTGHSIAEARADSVTLTTGEQLATRSLIWCVGVRPDSLVAQFDLPLDGGRLVVGADLAVPNAPDLFACGDCAAVPDLTRPGQLTGMTAQHAQRQGARVAANVAATLGHGAPRPYRHRDLGFLVDLGGLQAAANPLHLPLSGLPAKIATRGYHLLALPGNRTRTAVDWALNTTLGQESVQLGLVDADAVPLEPVRRPAAVPTTGD